MPKIKIGALISGGGTNLQAIIDACENGLIDGEMVFVGTDNPEAKGLQRAQMHNIPHFSVDYQVIINQFKQSNEPDQLLPDDFDLPLVRNRQAVCRINDLQQIDYYLKTRACAEAALLKRMHVHGFDLLVLAGFMRTLSPYFIDKVNTNPEKPRIMNIHPALLPAFPGTDGYGDTFRYGCKVGGCTVHFIDYGEDSGPIIGQKAFSILPTDTLDSIRQKGLALEWQLYPQCIQAFAENRLQINKTTVKDESGLTYNRSIVTIL